MSDFEKPNPDSFDIQKAIREILDAPEWEGFAIPYPDKIKRYVSASTIVKSLFADAQNVTKVFSEPEPFHEDCGGEIDIFCDKNPYSFAVFQNKKAISKVLDFFSLVDDVSITAERDTAGNPMLIISWSIFDIFAK